MRKWLLFMLMLSSVVLATPNQGMKMDLLLTSSAFQHNAVIPAKYSCDDQNISPPISWQNAPEGTKSFVLIVDDPDAPAGTWDHWVLFNVPANTTSLPENVADLPNGTQVGKNSWGKTNYGGPCPPRGTHRYFFKLYALDTVLDLPEGATKQQIEVAMMNHVLADAELVGKYQRY